MSNSDDSDHSDGSSDENVEVPSRRLGRAVQDRYVSIYDNNLFCNELSVYCARRPMTLEQIEEHGLILAIQAAHEASLIGHKKALTGGGPDTRTMKLSASVGAHAANATPGGRFVSTLTGCCLDWYS